MPCMPPSSKPALLLSCSSSIHIFSELTAEIESSSMPCMPSSALNSSKLAGEIVQPTRIQLVLSNSEAWGVTLPLTLPLTREALKCGGELDASLSEKGVLQLLFDWRFMRDCLASGKPLALAGKGLGGSGSRPGDPAAAAAADQRRAGAEVESALQVSP